MNCWCYGIGAFWSIWTITWFNYLVLSNDHKILYITITCRIISSIKISQALKVFFSRLLSRHLNSKQITRFRGLNSRFLANIYIYIHDLQLRFILNFKRFLQVFLKIEIRLVTYLMFDVWGLVSRACDTRFSPNSLLTTFLRSLSMRNDPKKKGSI